MTNKRKPIKSLICAAVCLLLLLILIVTLTGKKETKESVAYRRILMGTMVEVTILDGDSARFDSAVKAAYQEIKGLETLFSSYKSLSDVSKISLNAGRGPINVSAEVATVTAAALDMARLTGGAFDPTVGSLAGVWGFSGETKKVPEAADIERLLPFVDYKGVTVDLDASTVELKRRGMAFNLGGIAKGYIVGRAVEALKERGVERAIIKAGGDMFAFNTTGKDLPFIIGIRDPREEGALIGSAHFAEGAIATSGDYERFFIEDGTRYHHILDPSTGYPAKGTRSVTIVAADPTQADVLSTSVFVMGAVKGMALIERLDEVEGLIIDSDGAITRSSGFSGEIF